MKRLLLPLVCLSVLAAGCADRVSDTADDLGDNMQDRADSVTKEQALSYLQGASENLPDRYGFDFRMSDAAGVEVFSMMGAVDDATERRYFTLKGDPSAFGEGSETGGEEMAAVFEEGFVIYTTPEGSLYLVNGTAFVFPPAEDDSPSDSYVPSPEESPFAGMLDPEDLLSDFAEENVTVESVTPTTYRGKPAVEVVVTSVDEDETVHAKITMFLDPSRIARIEVEGFELDDAPEGMEGGKLVGDIFYDEEAKLEIPSDVTRSLGLAYKSDADPFASGGSEGESTTVTWTFLVSGGISASEVEVHAKEPTASGGYEPGEAPTLWTMKLSDGTMTQDGATATFNDVDGDGKVSAGDTLVFTVSNDGPVPTFALRDTVTGYYVVPGPALFALFAALGAVALALRRR